MSTVGSARRALCGGLLGLLVGTCAAQAVPAGSAVALRGPADGAVTLHGTANMAGVSARDTKTLYPGPNAGVFLGAVLAHALVSDSQQEAQRRKLQEQADAGVVHERAIMQTLSYAELMEEVVQRVPWEGERALAPADPVPPGRWLVATLPRFSLSEDRMALVLDNVVTLTAPGAGKPAAQVQLRVVSQAHGSNLWATGGQAARAESVRLLAHSLELALRHGPDTAGAGAGGSQTLRYREGAADRIERVRPLQRYCARLAVRDLRGAVLSVPARGEDPDPADCRAALPDWK